MKIVKFEDILAWQKAKELSILSYKLFRSNRDFKFRDQILSASVSVMNNIAEGFDRGGDKEFSRFLIMSKGSCGEVKSMMYLALELKYVTQNDFKKIYNLSVEISKMLNGLIKYLKE